MRTVNSDTPQAVAAPNAGTTYKGMTYSATLSDGREITIREMKGSDLIYMEEDLGKFGETKKSFYLIERLNVGADKISFDEISELGIKDIKIISELVFKANGGNETESDPK